MDVGSDEGRQQLEDELDQQLSEARTLLHSGKFEEAEKKLAGISPAAEASQLDRIQSRACTVLGSIKLENGDVDAALGLFRVADRLLTSFPAAERSDAVAGIARCCKLTGKTMYAIQLLEGYLVELESEGTFAPAASMRTHSTLLGCYQSLGMMRQASTAAERAMKYADHVDDEEQIACMSMNVARVLLDQGRYPEAVDAIEKAEQIYARLGWNMAAARARSKRGIVEAERGNLNEARAALTEALGHLGSAGPTRIDRAYTLDELGRVERLLEHIPEAKARLQEARALLDERDLVELGMNAREMGLCLAEEDPQAAARELEKALGHYQAAGASAQVATTMLYLGRILKEQGKLDAALDVFGLPIEPRNPKGGLAGPK